MSHLTSANHPKRTTGHPAKDSGGGMIGAGVIPWHTWVVNAHPPHLTIPCEGVVVDNKTDHELNGYRHRRVGWFGINGYHEVRWLEVTPDDYARHWDLEGPR